MDTAAYSPFYCYMCIFIVLTCFFARSILCLSVYEIMFNQFYTDILPADS